MNRSDGGDLWGPGIGARRPARISTSGRRFHLERFSVKVTLAVRTFAPRIRGGPVISTEIDFIALDDVEAVLELLENEGDDCTLLAASRACGRSAILATPSSSEQ